LPDFGASAAGNGYIAKESDYIMSIKSVFFPERIPVRAGRSRPVGAGVVPGCNVGQDAPVTALPKCGQRMNEIAAKAVQ
jgi:hypothetical protein